MMAPMHICLQGVIMMNCNGSSILFEVGIDLLICNLLICDSFDSYQGTLHLLFPYSFNPHILFKINQLTCAGFKVSAGNKPIHTCILYTK